MAGDAIDSDRIFLISDDPAPSYSTPTSIPHGDEIARLPLYQVTDSGPHLTLDDLHQILHNPNRQRDNDINVWQTFIDSNPKWNKEDPQGIVAEGFSFAITAGQEDVVALLIQHDLVSANTEFNYETPLLKAVKAKNIGVLRKLLDLGADKDAFGYVSWHWGLSGKLDGTARTPLQMAASMGNLVMVKILIEEYHCDDSLVAPDGQIALRLAVENGHKEVVDYLPTRRGGGFRRWKHKNKHSIERMKRASRNIGKFVKFFVWDIEKFFLWSIPKHLFVKPALKGIKWCWGNRKKFGPWLGHRIAEIPAGFMKLVSFLGRAAVKIGKGSWKFATETFPRMIKTLAIGLWKFLTETLPRIGKSVAVGLWDFLTKTVPWIMKTLAVWLWKLVSEKIPDVLLLLAKWIGRGVTSVAKVVWNVLMKVVSLVSTVLEAIVSFFQRVTLKDIWNGFCDVLHAVLVAFPRLLGSWVMAFGKGSYKLMKLLFGEIGEIFWYIGYGITWLVMYLPGQFWKILESIGASFGKAGYEVKVWMNPKAA